MTTTTTTTTTRTTKEQEPTEFDDSETSWSSEHQAAVLILGGGGGGKSSTKTTMKPAATWQSLLFAQPQQQQQQQRKSLLVRSHSSSLRSPTLKRISSRRALFSSNQQQEEQRQDSAQTGGVSEDHGSDAYKKCHQQHDKQASALPFLSHHSSPRRSRMAISLSTRNLLRKLSIERDDDDDDDDNSNNSNNDTDKDNASSSSSSYSTNKHTCSKSRTRVHPPSSVVAVADPHSLHKEQQPKEASSLKVQQQDEEGERDKKCYSGSSTATSNVTNRRTAFLNNRRDQFRTSKSNKACGLNFLVESTRELMMEYDDIIKDEEDDEDDCADLFDKEQGTENDKNNTYHEAPYQQQEQDSTESTRNKPRPSKRFLRRHSSIGTSCSISSSGTSPSAYRRSSGGQTMSSLLEDYNDIVGDNNYEDNNNDHDKDTQHNADSNHARPSGTMGMNHGHQQQHSWTTSVV
ncbi:hypothetical protein ACA910_015850 [Epithemia clementina (nom. ined.)]